MVDLRTVETVKFVLSLAILVIGWCLYLPQLTRVIRLKSAAGIAVTGLLNGAINFTAWIAYFLRRASCTHCLFQ